MITEVDNWDLSVHRREATRVQNVVLINMLDLKELVSAALTGTKHTEDETNTKIVDLVKYVLDETKTLSGYNLNGDETLELRCRLLGGTDTQPSDVSMDGASGPAPAASASR